MNKTSTILSVARERSPPGERLPRFIKILPSSCRGIEFIMENTGDEDLTMYVVNEPVPRALLRGKTCW